MKSKSFMRITLIIVFLFSIIGLQGQRLHRHHKKQHKHTPHYKYTKLPKWGHALMVVPNKARLIKHGKCKYHYHSGVFYKVNGAKYVIAKAPIGIRVQTLPKAKLLRAFKGKTYYYYYGTYYIKADKGYVTVEPPIGIVIDALPDGYTEIKTKEDVLYEFEGVYYKPTTGDDGEEWYEVVKVK